MNDQLTDRVIVCECGTEFTFTVKEQEFYQRKNFADPRRCKSCRIKKKQQRLERGQKGTNERASSFDPNRRDTRKFKGITQVRRNFNPGRPDPRLDDLRNDDRDW